MAHMAQQSILKMEISENYVCTEHLVCGGEVKISLIELGYLEWSTFLCHKWGTYRQHMIVSHYDRSWGVCAE
jgi:hypothetical protein